MSEYVCDWISDNVEDRVDDRVGEPVWVSVMLRVGKPVWHRLNHRVGESVLDNVGDPIWHSIVPDRIASTSEYVWERIWLCIRDRLWLHIGDSDDRVGESVWDSAAEDEDSVWLHVREPLWRSIRGRS